MIELESLIKWEYKKTGIKITVANIVELVEDANGKNSTAIIML